MKTEDQDLREYRDFRGLRNTAPPVGFDDLGDTEVAINMDVDDALILHRRKGHGAVLVAGVDRDLWAEGAVCLGVGSNALKQIHPNWSTTTLRTGLTAGPPLAYAAVGDRVFYSNGFELGAVQGGAHRTWGLAVPPAPLLTAAGGDLRRGRYQVVLTYLRADGQESGATKASVIELTDTGGISLAPMPVSDDPTVTHKAIYVSSVDAENLWLQGVVTNASTDFSVLQVRESGNPLTTQFLSAPPAGEMLGYWNGWMLVGKGSRLYPSEPYAPELFDVRKSVPFLDRITMIAPVDAGVWIGTASQVIWLTGDEPSKWTYIERSDAGVIPGTFAYGSRKSLGEDSKEEIRIAYFATTGGLCAGLENGSLLNLTEERFAYPAMDRGAGVVRKQRGIHQYVTTLRGTEVAASVAT